MVRKKTLFLSDQKGNTYELIINPTKLPEGTLNAIEGIRRTNKRNLWSTLLGKINSKKTKKPGKAMPSPQSGRDKLVNLEEEGHDLYSAKSSNNQESSNPFIPPLSKVKLSVGESIKLERFLNAIKKVESASELGKVVYAALDDGVRINVCHRGQRSFVDTVVLKMLLMQCPKDTQEIIIEELLLKGAMFSYDLFQNKQVSEVYNKLRPKVQPKIEKRLQELREVGENAIENGGSVEEVGIENKTFFMEFSENSEINVAKVIEGARDLGLNTGEVKLEGDIIKIGNSEVEIRSGEGGKRDYVDMADNSAFEMTFPTSIGRLRIVVHHSAENDLQAQVRVVDTEMWAELQKRGETVGKNCLFGGKTVKEVVEKGGFIKHGRWSEGKTAEEIKAVSNNGPSETISWVDKTSKNSSSQENSRG